MKDLELFAMEFLRFEKRCRVAIVERSPRPHHGQPDVLGITNDRYLLEIEIKRSVSDFKANALKPHIQQRGLLRCQPLNVHWPKMFWYLVPYDLVEKVRPLVPDWAGLLRGPGTDETQQLYSVIKAQPNSASKRLTVKECIKLFNCMSNQLYSQYLQINRSCNGGQIIEAPAALRARLEEALR